jgi:hypothetical protein
MEQMKYLNRDEYELVLQEQYNLSTSADIIQLINDSKKYSIEIYANNNNVVSERLDFILSIITQATEFRRLSFKQWKALKAFCRDNRVANEIETKTF